MTKFLIALAKPNALKRAVDFLQTQGCEVVAPRQKIAVLRNGRQTATERPALDRYMLVRGADPKALEGAPGLSRFVLSAPERYATVSESAVRTLERALAPVPSGKRKIRTWITKGMRVEIFRGALAGHEGLIRAVKFAQGRVHVWIEQFKRAVWLPLADVVVV